MEYLNVKLIQTLALYGFNVSTAYFKPDGEFGKIRRMVYAQKKSSYAVVSIKVINNVAITKFIFGKKSICDIHRINTMKNFDYFSAYLKELSN